MLQHAPPCCINMLVVPLLPRSPFPCSLLEQMQADLQAGKFVYRPPWASESSGNKTGHSCISSLGAAFLTPGVLDERRSSATPSLVSAIGRRGCRLGCCVAVMRWLHLLLHGSEQPNLIQLLCYCCLTGRDRRHDCGRRN